MTDAVQVARGMLVARVEHSFECDSESIMQGSCDCDREELVDAYRAALLADVRAAVEAMPTFTVTGSEYRVIRYVDRDAIGAVLDAMALGA
jgi:hypothetical protein